MATLARNVDAVDLSDLTTAKRTGPAEWVSAGVLDIPFDRVLTTVEVAAITLRLTNKTNDLAILCGNLDTFLATASPTSTQVVSAFKDLIRLYRAQTDRGQS